MPPPAAFANEVPAWASVAEQLRGRLELGHMVVRDRTNGLDRVELGCDWSRTGLLLGATARVRIDLPLTFARSLDAPEILAAARDLWKELAGKVALLRITRTEVTVEVAGKLVDPASALPIVELAGRLRRALGGQGWPGRSAEPAGDPLHLKDSRLERSPWLTPPSIPRTSRSRVATRMAS